MLRCCRAAVPGTGPALRLRSPSREHRAIRTPRALFPGQRLCPPVFPSCEHGLLAEEEEGARLAGCCAAVAAWGAQLGPCRGGVPLRALCRMASHPQLPPPALSRRKARLSVLSRCCHRGALCEPAQSQD